MKPKSLLLAGALLFCGCTSIPKEGAAELDRAAVRYASVTKEMTREAILITFGAPQKEEASKAVWITSYDPDNYVSLSVEFDETGHPIETIITRGVRSSGLLGAVGHTQYKGRSYR